MNKRVLAVSDKPEPLDYAPPPPRGAHPIETGLKVILALIAIGLGLLFILAIAMTAFTG